MKYFITEQARKETKSTCYFEFQMGPFEEMCWMESSLNLHMDLWDELKLSRLLKQALDEFDYYGVSTVGKTEWESMVQIADQEASPWKEVLEELTPWVEECFQEYDCFIILGI